MKNYFLKFRTVFFVVFLLPFILSPVQFSWAQQHPFTTGSNDEIIAYIDQMVKTKSKDKNARAAMVALLKDPGAAVSVRERVAWAMGQLDIQSDINVLVEAAKDKGLLVRSAALDALIQMRSRNAYSVLLNIAQNDPVLSMRQRAVLGIGLLRWDKAVNDLAQLSNDERPEVRAAAALAMAATHSSKNDFTKILQEMKTDPDPFVQVRAQCALEQAQGKKGVVAKHLEAEDKETRLFAAQFFRYRGGRADLKTVKTAFNSEADENVRAELAAAARAIEKRSQTQNKPAKEKKL